MSLSRLEIRDPIIKHGDSNSDVLICFDTKFNLSVSYIFESDINIIKLYIRHSEERLVEWSEAHYFDELIHQYTSCEFESRLCIFLSKN